MLKALNNKKGVTLTELVVAMLVMSIIMLSVTTVFLPVYNAYTYANNLAEVNNLLDSLSSVILSDLENASGDVRWDGTALTIPTRHGGAGVTYTVNDELLERNGTPVYARGFYKAKTVELDAEADVNNIITPGPNGAITVTIIIRDRTGVMAIRDYAARPVGMG
jgi:prepilin-type N-terminal cleavage/methylation domain-containing protein